MSTYPTRARRPTPLPFLVVALGVNVAPGTSQSASKLWIGSRCAFWDHAGNWSPAGEPGVFDTATNTSPATVNYRSSTAPPTDAVGVATATLVHAQDTLNTFFLLVDASGTYQLIGTGNIAAGNTTAGQSSTATFTQSGGKHSTADLLLGENGNGDGTCG